MRVDQIQTEAAEEELLDEARMFPLGLARILRDVASFLLGREVGFLLGHGGLSGM
jgi:hypothetical protein